MSTLAKRNKHCKCTVYTQPVSPHISLTVKKNLPVRDLYETNIHNVCNVNHHWHFYIFLYVHTVNERNLKLESLETGWDQKFWKVYHLHRLNRNYFEEFSWIPYQIHASLILISQLSHSIVEGKDLLITKKTNKNSLIETFLSKNTAH